MDAKEITSDLKTIKKCLKLIQDANSDTTKIAKQISILEDVSIVKSMIKVSTDFGSVLDVGSATDVSCQTEVGSAFPR